MKKNSPLRAALVCILAMTLICGFAYTFLMTGIGQAIFPKQVNGSLVKVEINGETVTVGSEFIGQQWSSPKYLIGRPNPGAPTNLSPVSDDQQEAVKERVAWWHEFDPETIGKEIPADLVTISGSGLDPHISKAAAYFQISRLAKERNKTEAEVKAIIDRHTQGRTFGFLGEETVNVLLVNVDLDGLKRVN